MANPKRFEVRWTPVAMRDVEQIIYYIEQRNPLNAMEQFERIYRHAQQLVLFPLRCRVVPELARIELQDYRELIIDPYRLVFRIGGRAVYVLGIFDGRRDLEEILFERLVRSF